MRQGGRWPSYRTRSSRGKSSAPASGTRAMAPMIQIAATRLVASAMAPSAGATMPPTETASPSVTPEACRTCQLAGSDTTSWTDTEDLAATRALVLAHRALLDVLEYLDFPHAVASDAVTTKRLRAFLAFIDEHAAEPVALEDIARAASVSVSECLRCFHAGLGTTPYRYLMDVRLERAARLLVETDLPVATVATRVGFRDASYFARQFRRCTGLSPRQYRAS